MNTVSIWRETTPELSFPILESDISVDVAIVGGGITGVTLAMLLAHAGRSVALVESKRIGLGSTGNSTGNLYALVSHGLHEVGKKWGDEVMRDVAQSRNETVAFIEQNARQLNINCAFRRCPLQTYATIAGAQESIALEYKAALQVGLEARMVSELPLPLVSGESLLVENQAQFHPLAYISGLARHAASANCRIFENSPITTIDDENRTIYTANGKVMAREIVLATHTPKGIYLVQAEMVPYREYGIALRLNNGSYPQGIFWGKGEYAHSVRSYLANNSQYLIVIGKEEKTGQHRASESFTHLETFARAHFDVLSVDYRWSAQNYHSPDYLPYIGLIAGSGVYIATGFATDGLTYGTLAARIIADQILGIKNRWSELYKASRLEPVRAARGLLEESMNVTKALIKDYLTSPQTAQLSTLAPGTGNVVEVNGEKIAAYRDERGALSLVSPVCTHMKCIVHWNDAERTWDCPCHGSRFLPDGSVIEGPAVTPLQPRRLPQ